MPQSHSAVYVHLVFSTKERRPWLRDLKLRTDLFGFLVGVSRQLDCPCPAIGGFEDHIHILGRLHRTITQADWVKELKRVSNSWIKDQRNGEKDFSWQAGYGIFSISSSNLDTVKEYVLRQEEHHRKTTFQDEYRILLKRHGLEWDESYVWE